MGRCGCRCKEAIDVKADDVFLDVDSGRNYLRVPAGKESKERKTPIPDEFVELIEKYTAYRDPDQPIIGVTTRTLRRWVVRAADQLRAETGDDRWRYLRPHDLRRTWGLLTLESGIHPSVVMEWGGCTDYEIFQEEYLRVHSLRTQAKEAEKLVPRPEEDIEAEVDGFNDAIERFVNQSYRILQTQPWTDEANTKAKIITPFIELLGWDVLSQNVALEYSEVGSGMGDKVDYALFEDGQPQVMVEAKRQDEPLGNSEIAQLKRYMRLHLCECGLLTNGRHYIVLRDYRESKLSDIDREVDCGLKELPANKSKLTPLMRT